MSGDTDTHRLYLVQVAEALIRLTSLAALISNPEVRIVFPAASEEDNSGARRVISDGLLEIAGMMKLMACGVGFDLDSLAAEVVSLTKAALSDLPDKLGPEMYAGFREYRGGRH